MSRRVQVPSVPLDYLSGWVQGRRDLERGEWRPDGYALSSEETDASWWDGYRESGVPGGPVASALMMRFPGVFQPVITAGGVASVRAKLAAPIPTLDEILARKGSAALAATSPEGGAR